MVFKYISQVDEEDCGIAALSMILNYYHTSIPLYKIRNMSGTTNEGTSILGIVSAAESLNFEVLAIEAGKELFDEDTIFPFIIHVIKENQFFHYYTIIKKHSNGYITYADPAPDVGIKKIKIDELIKEWTGAAILFEPKEEYIPLSIEPEKQISLLRLIGTQKKVSTLIIFITIFITVISVVGTYYYKFIIDDFIPKNQVNLLTVFSLGLLAMYFFQQIFQYFKTYLLFILNQRLLSHIMLEYLSHVIRLPMTFFGTRKTGDILSRFNDVSKITEAIASSIISVFLDVWIVIGVSAFLFSMNKNLFILIFFLYPIYASLIYVFLKSFDHSNRDIMKASAKLNSSIIENISNIETLKSLGAEELELDKTKHTFFAYINSIKKFTKLTALQSSLKIFVQSSTSVLVLWLGAQYVLNQQISLGELITYNILLNFLFEPLQNILNLQNTLQSAEVAKTRLNEILSIEPEDLSRKIDNKDYQLKNGIKFKGVSYKSGIANPILNNLNFEIKKGTITTIVGTSGSGKTTLAKMLVRFFETSSGQILIDDMDISEIPKKSLREHVNYFPQKVSLISGTIKENLLLGLKKDILLEDIERACEIVCLKDEIECFPLKYDTYISSQENFLSGGQRQRLALARSILSGAEVLILDEATNSLDVITEKKILENIINLQNKTILFIAHRLSIAKISDKILVIEKGNLSETGNYDELIEKKGLFYQFSNAN